MNKQTKYNIINLAKLETKKIHKYYDSVNIKKKLFNTKCKHYPTCKCESLFYQENCECVINSNKAFFESFLYAYNNHKDIILSPDDIWFVISLQFTKYVDKNSEKMRNMFVSHNGKKNLTIVTSEKSEYQWDEFFNKILIEIKKNTQNDVVDLLQNNFTTTTYVEKLLSTAIIMNTTKHYFNYCRVIPMCGIRNVLFEGTPDDWQLLQHKINDIKKYAVCDIWTNYIDKIEPIIGKFIDTYNNNIDNDFWNTIMNLKYGRLGSGTIAKVSGWILNFYGIYDECDIDNITENLIDVPVELVNELTGITKMTYIVGGFTGITTITKISENDIEYDAYKPQMALSIITDGININEIN
jgi:hypothetical protein